MFSHSLAPSVDLLARNVLWVHYRYIMGHGFSLSDFDYKRAFASSLHLALIPMSAYIGWELGHPSLEAAGAGADGHLAHSGSRLFDYYT